MAIKLFQDAVKLQNLTEYRAFLQKALHRVSSGISFDNYITSELIVREKIELLGKLQLAEKESLSSILESELNDVYKQINEELKC